MLFQHLGRYGARRHAYKLSRGISYTTQNERQMTNCSQDSQEEVCQSGEGENKLDKIVDGFDLEPTLPKEVLARRPDLEKHDTGVDRCKERAV
jgi:hypothetical protein